MEFCFSINLWSGLSQPAWRGSYLWKTWFWLPTLQRKTETKIINIMNKVQLKLKYSAPDTACSSSSSCWSCRCLGSPVSPYMAWLGLSQPWEISNPLLLSQPLNSWNTSVKQAERANTLHVTRARLASLEKNTAYQWFLVHALHVTVVALVAAGVLDEPAVLVALRSPGQVLRSAGRSRSCPSARKGHNLSRPQAGERSCRRRR